MLTRNPAVHEILELPEIDPAYIDGLFQIRPSSVDRWMGNINSRELSTMELGAISHEDLNSLADGVKEAVASDGSDNERALIAAGVLYGALIAGDSKDQDDGIDQRDLEAAKDTITSAYNSADDDYLSRFFAIRNCEIDHFSSDVISVTFSSIQDHIAAIASSGDKLQNQVMFYTGAVAGAMAVLPKDEVHAETPAIVTRDFPDAIGQEGYFPIRVEHEAVDGALDMTIAALGQQIGFRNDNDKTLTVRNNRLIQFEPNGVTTHNDGPKIPVSDVAKVIYIEKDAHGLPEPTRSAVGMITRKNGFAFNAYHPSHPYYDYVSDSLLEAHDNGVIVPPDKLYVVTEEQGHQRTIRRASIAAASILGAEQVVFPNLTQTLAAFGALALGNRLLSRSMRKKSKSELDV